MLTRLVKSIVNTSNNTLAIGTADTNITNTVLKRIANTNTNTFMTILFTVFTFSNVHFFTQSSINKANKMTVVEKMAISL